MARAFKSNARDMTNFKEFPGEITDRGWYEFPTLYHTDGFDHQRVWKIVIRLIKKASKKKKYGYDWELTEDEVPIRPRYLDDADLPDGTIAQMWAETGVTDGKMTRHPCTFPRVTNEGKKNERNYLKQGLVDARSKWIKKTEQGHLQLADFEKSKGKKVTKTLYFPMLLFKYNNEKKHINFPALVQRKLDGQRYLAYLRAPPSEDQDYHDVVIYSRLLKIHQGFDYIKRILLAPLQEAYDTETNESYYMDGEFYKHGKNLQQVGALIKNVKKTIEKRKSSAEFWVFDGFYPSKLDKTFAERNDALNAVFTTFPDTHWIRKVDTLEVENEKELMSYYEQFIAEGYEGAIVRDLHGEYLADPLKSSQRLRSRKVLKLKKRFSKEYPVVGFEQGTKGRDVGAILWTVDVGEKTLTLQPKNMTLKERKEIYSDALKNFADKYEGRMMTVEYEDLSKDLVPLRAKAAGFREN